MWTAPHDHHVVRGRNDRRARRTGGIMLRTAAFVIAGVFIALATDGRPTRLTASVAAPAAPVAEARAVASRVEEASWAASQVAGGERAATISAQDVVTVLAAARGV